MLIQSLGVLFGCGVFYHYFSLMFQKLTRGFYVRRRRLITPLFCPGINLGIVLLTLFSACFISKIKFLFFLT